MKKKNKKQNQNYKNMNASKQNNKKILDTIDQNENTNVTEILFASQALATAIPASNGDVVQLSK